ncbi:hypothetical protein I8751_19395 [Nostocaceae cyanobacterium CENA357]|uniref:Uncharacterized protein n=1 Tax=Atlanticothrix silvestris CENA357 TaxID=1725252 RepID=A0A8J7HH02_9CYAN|nr:hypothetical protein [Atlanticothrix silvestris CENA357]
MVLINNPLSELQLAVFSLQVIRYFLETVTPDIFLDDSLFRFYARNFALPNKNISPVLFQVLVKFKPIPVDLLNEDLVFEIQIDYSPIT